MPRKTPVRELQKEESVPNSPLRRSSRLNNSSPVPTKVISRRNSASETSASTPVVTRSRRSSFSQELQSSEDLQADKKKATSTIRTRRSSLTQNKDDQTQVDSIVKTRARSTSKEPEQIPEVKKTTGRRRSNTEDSEQDASKKATRSRSSSLTKKNEVIETQSNKKQSFTSTDVSASTPIKKSPSQSTSDVLESIEETNKEVESPSGSPSKKLRKRVTEVSRIDFDLSVINEASLTEEETSPRKKSTIMDKVEEDQSETTSVQNVLEAEKNEDSSKAINDETVKKSTENEPESHNIVAKEGLSNKKVDTAEKHDSTASDSSFNLQLSPLENSNQNKVNASNKENISPKVSKCEPMEVDEVSQESPVKKKLLKSPKATAKVEINEVEKTLQVTAKVTEFLPEEILSNSQKNEKGNIQDIVVLATIDEEPLDKTKKNLNLEEAVDLNKGKSFEKEVSKQVEKDVSTIEDEVVEKNEQVARNSPSAEIPENLIEPEKKVEETPEIDTVKETSSIENISNENELNKSTEIMIEEQSTDKDVHSSSNGDIEGEITRQASEQIIENVKSSPRKKDHESDATQKISTKNTVVHNLAENAAQEKTPTKTPSKVISYKDKNSFEEQAEPEESVTPDENIISDALVRPDTNGENETKESSPVEEKKSLHKSTEEKMEEDANEKSGIEEQVINIEEYFCDKDETAAVVTLKEKEHVAESGQKESNVLRQIKSQEIVTVSESSIDEDLDLEVKIINESKTVMSEKRRSDGGKNVNLCDPDSSEEEEPNHDGSVVKKPETCYSVSDDEIFISKKETNKEKNVDKLERSIDSKYIITGRGKTQKGGKSQSDSNSELIELSDEEENDEDQENEVFDEASDYDDSSDTNQTMNAEPVAKRNDDKVNKIKEEKKDVLNVSTSGVKKHSADRRSITLQETIKAGDDPEQKLSGHIHKVVDLFCASIKNKSDLSINVSMEYAEHLADSEDENGKGDIVNISLTAWDIGEKEVEPVKGSKRRKIYHVSNDDIKSPEKVHTYKNEDGSMFDNPNEISQNSSDINDEEKVSSAKKRKKRKSDVLQQAENIAVKTPPKVSFSTDIEDKNKSAKKTKKRRSIGDVSPSDNELTEQKEQGISPIRKPVPLTPFKVKKSKHLEESSDSAEESSDEDDENNENGVNNYDNLFCVSFEESDVNDVTWMPDEDVKSDHSDSEVDMVTEEETQQDEAPIIGTIKRRRQSNSRSSNEEESQTTEKTKKTSQNGSSSSLEDFLPDSVNKKEENLSKNKKRKLFRLSKLHNLSQAFASSETEENVKMEQAVSTSTTKTQSTDFGVDQKKSNIKNKSLKQTFSSKTVECMLPETSEVQEKPIKMNRKRRHPTSPNLENEEEPMKNENKLSKKKMKDTKRKHVSPSIIRPSASNIKNLKSLHLKPSTKRNSGWDVTTM